MDGSPLDLYVFSPQKVNCWNPTKVEHKSGVFYKLDQVQWLIIDKLPHNVHLRNFHEAGLYVGYLTWVGYADYVNSLGENGNLLLEEMKFDFDLPIEIFSRVDDEDVIPLIMSGGVVFDQTPQEIDEMNKEFDKLSAALVEGENTEEMKLISLRKRVKSSKTTGLIEMNILKLRK